MFEKLFESIFPIIYYDEHQTPKVAGTSIFAEHNGKYFLLTAAHLLRGIGNEYLPHVLLPSEKAIPLLTKACMSRLPADGATHELDIAYFYLDNEPEVMEYMKQCADISLRDYDEPEDNKEEYYYILGYPYRKAPYKKKTNELQAKPLSYMTVLVEDSSEYTKLKRSEEFHILVKYHTHKTKGSEGERKIAPLPHGISGGPLFRILKDKDTGHITIILEGLLTDWRERKLILATRKNKIREFIDSTLHLMIVESPGNPG